MLNPTSIEKSSVALANSCFHESTIFALRYYSSHGYPYFKETADFLQIIRDWFNVVNCKSKFMGQQKIDKRRDAVYFDNRHQLEFLQSFYEWLNGWSTLANKRGFSKPTFHHAQVSSLSLIHLANYLLDRKKLSYVLFGHIQSDCIEGRFGWSRQLSGGNYFNSVLQFVQAEKKIRVKCLVKMGYLMNEVKEIFQSSDDVRTREINIAVDDILRKISEFDFEFKFIVDSSDEATVYYTEGAIVRCLLRREKCSSCIKLLSNNNETINIKITDIIVESDERQFLSLCNRGGLTKPSDLVFIACVHSWSLYCFLFDDPELWDIVISSYNPRKVFTQVYLKELTLS